MVDTAPSDRAGSGQPAPARRMLGSLSAAVLPVSEASLAAYAALCSSGSAAPPQSVAWVGTWARASRLETFVALLSADGLPVYALPLEIAKAGPFRIARFMSDRHANGNFPPAAGAFVDQATAGHAQQLAAAIGAAGLGVDVVALERLLPDFEGSANPLAKLAHQASPNLSLAVSLEGGFDALLGRASGKRKRKKHRSQTRKFEAAGGYRRFEARTADEVERVLDAFFAMKQLRFRKAGIPDVFAQDDVRSFFRTLFGQALKGGGPPAFVLHALEVDGRIRAVTGSSRAGKRLICEFGAIAEDDLAHTSPGDFLFFDNIQEACRQGFDVYDFSVGDEPYKRLWCDVETRHFDVLLPLTAKGRLLALQMRCFARFKAFVKGNETIWKIAKLLRKRTAGQPAPGED